MRIRSRTFDPDGPENRTKRRTSRNSRIEKRMRVPPIVEANIKFNGLDRDVRLDVGKKDASFLICWDSDIVKPELIVSSEGIDEFVMGRIERARRILPDDPKSDRLTVNIGIMKEHLGLTKNGSDEWEKKETKVTHVLNLPTKFKIAKTEHAILSIGKDGLTVTPLTEQEGWVKMISPKEYNFTFDVKPGESAMVKFGFKW